MKVKFAGTDQSSTPRPALCGASTEVKERKGQEVKSSEPNVQFQRVEIWFIPSGAAVPAELSGLQDVPAADVKKLGCPK
jgi:hypothetical protein